MRTCFVADASVWFGNGLYDFKGLDNIIEFFRTVLTPVFFSSHIALQPELHLTGPESATGIWRMQDIVYFTGPNPNLREGEIKGGEEMQGAGYYHDSYVKRDGVWMIASSGYVRLLEKILSADQTPLHVKCEPRRGMVS